VFEDLSDTDRVIAVLTVERENLEVKSKKEKGKRKK